MTGDIVQNSNSNPYVFHLAPCSTLRDLSNFKGIPQLKLEDQQMLHLKVVGAPMPNHLCAEFARIAEEERKKEADAEQQGKEREKRKRKRRWHSLPIMTGHRSEGFAGQTCW